MRTMARGESDSRMENGKWNGWGVEKGLALG